MAQERPYLLPAAWLYGGVVAARNAAFDSGVFRARDAGVPVISIGNISTGGTGKTPLAEETARVLLEQGYTVGVLSRGYGRSTTGFRWVQRDDRTDTDASLCGDEPVQIALNVPGALVAVDADRVAGARRMIEEAGVQAIILDDGFQHRWIRRACDVVTVRWDEVFGKPRLLPVGRLREPVRSLRRASLVVVTGCEDDETCRKAVRGVGLNSEAEVLCSKLSLSGVRDLGTGRDIDIAALSGARVVALSGIGHPRSFHATLREYGMNVVSELVHEDHHAFSGKDIVSVRRAVADTSADAVIMTQKDAVRIRGDHAANVVGAMRTYYTTVQPVWVSGRDRFVHHIVGAVRAPEEGT